MNRVSVNKRDSPAEHLRRPAENIWFSPVQRLLETIGIELGRAGMRKYGTPFARSIDKLTVDRDMVCLYAVLPTVSPADICQCPLR